VVTLASGDPIAGALLGRSAAGISNRWSGCSASSRGLRRPGSPTPREARARRCTSPPTGRATSQWTGGGRHADPGRRRPQRPGPGIVAFGDPAALGGQQRRRRGARGAAGWRVPRSRSRAARSGAAHRWTTRWPSASGGWLGAGRAWRPEQAVARGGAGPAGSAGGVVRSHPAADARGGHRGVLAGLPRRAAPLGRVPAGPWGRPELGRHLGRPHPLDMAESAGAKELVAWLGGRGARSASELR
jgi:hypothetical protein